MFPSEEVLVRRFSRAVRSVSSFWGKVEIATEFFYKRGRTDLVAVSENGQVIAFEAKLKNWRDALQQAYRNKCFADLSYVVLPEDAALLAARYEAEFLKRGVGLCSVAGNTITVMQEAASDKPLQPWLREEALAFVSSSSKN